MTKFNNPVDWVRRSSEKRFASVPGAPKTFNVNDRTVDVVMSRGSPVTRAYGTEKLRISQSAVDLSRMDTVGIPVLDSHSQASIDNIVGKVVRAWVENDSLLGRIRFAESDRGERAMQLCAQGIVSGVSVGYAVAPNDWVITDKNGKELDPERDAIRASDDLTFEARRWSVYELSLCAVPADPQAHTRSLNSGNPIGAARATKARMRMRLLNAKRGIL